MGTFPQTLLFVSDSGQIVEYYLKKPMSHFARGPGVKGLPNKVEKLVTFGNVLKEGDLSRAETDRQGVVGCTVGLVVIK